MDRPQLAQVPPTPRGQRGGKGEYFAFIRVSFCFALDKLPSPKLLVCGGVIVQSCAMQQWLEQPGCCWMGGGPRPPANPLCCLKNSRANNLNYTPASLGVGDDAFVYQNPDVKAKIVSCLQGYMLYRSQRKEQPAAVKGRSAVLSSKIHLRCWQL